MPPLNSKKFSRFRDQPTPAQQAALVAIREFRRLKDVSPTLDELAEKLGVSKRTVRQSLATLRRKGLVTSMPGCFRSIAMTRRGQIYAKAAMERVA